MILSFQKNEITEYHIYLQLAEIEKIEKNKKVLLHIASDELKHYEMFKKITGKDILPDKFKIWKYVNISRLLGLTFGLKLMENGEGGAQKAYAKMAADVPGLSEIIKEEDAHERELVSMIDEERLQYIGSVVLGLNDALVELTGALAGMTFALANAKLVATAGAITGIAASLSMAASEFLSTKSEDNGKSPIKACIYTGITYIVTVTALILPYLLSNNLILSLFIMLVTAVVIIFIFTFYISVAKDMDFRKRFIEMTAISLGVAAVSFFIGLAVRLVLNINI